MSSEIIGTREEKRRAKKRRYLAGECRKPYSHTPVLSVRGGTPGKESSLSPEQRSKVCAKCSPVLSRYVDTFNGLVHQGSELKKRKHMNPSPCNPSRKHYRDMNRQNDWIRENLFDPMGNYLFCCKCVCVALSISKQRLSRQRNIKRSNARDPVVDMTKEDVESQQLGDFVVMPTSVDMSFLTWWRSVDVDDTVQVRYPHHRHGHAGKPSHSSKPKVREDFLATVK